MVLLLTAFRLAWPAFAYSIDDDARGAADVRVRPDVPRARDDLGGDARSRSSPRGSCGGSRRRRSRSRRASSARSRSPPSRSPATSWSRSASGRARRTQFNWVVTGAAAVVNIALNLLLIPPYGMMGAAIATIAAYTTMFVGMAWWSQHIYPVAYQWRRVATAARDRSRPGRRRQARRWRPAGRRPARSSSTRSRCSRSASTCPSERRAIGARLRLAR